MNKKERATVNKLLDKHKKAIDELFLVVDKMPDVLGLAVTMEDGSHEINLAPYTCLSDFPKQEQKELKVLLGLCVVKGGGIVVRQRLPLKVEAQDNNGQKVWQHQQRIFGFFCGEGTFSGLTSKELKEAFGDESDDYEVLVRDRLTLFGDGKELIKITLEKVS